MRDITLYVPACTYEWCSICRTLFHMSYLVALRAPSISNIVAKVWLEHKERTKTSGFTIALAGHAEDRVRKEQAPLLPFSWGSRGSKSALLNAMIC